MLRSLVPLETQMGILVLRGGNRGTNYHLEAMSLSQLTELTKCWACRIA